MINFNGTIGSNQADLLTQNRAFLYGDAVFETVRIVNSKILFLEDHYFRLMSSMRVIRMEIPMKTASELQIETQEVGLNGSPTKVLKVFSPEVPQIESQIINEENSDLAVDQLLEKLVAAGIVKR